MISISLERQAAYRVLVPKWAVAPTSGAGAARVGGRANRPGTEALYLALDPETAIREYQQLSTLMPPGTLVSYQVSLDRVIDFRAGYQPRTWPPLWQDFYCDWREMWFNRHIEPPSWVIGDQVIASGARGILFQSSLRPQGSNLVLYPQAFTGTDTVSVYDPGHLLPGNQDSWR